MRRMICGFLLISLLFLAGCSSQPDITGVWEQELELSILGLEAGQAATVMSTARFTFREDGTGKQEVIIPDSSHPDTGREFTYTLEGDALTLNYGENQTETFTAVLEKDTFQMNNQRGQYKLTRVTE